MSHKAIVIMIVMSPMLSGFTPRPSQSSPPRPRPALTLPKTEIALCCDGAGTRTATRAEQGPEMLKCYRLLITF